MNKKVSIMALAFAALASAAENPHFSPYPVDNKPDPDWKRKKCKSCIDCGKVCNGRKWSKPTDSACCNYKPKKKGK